MLRYIMQKLLYAVWGLGGLAITITVVVYAHQIDSHSLREASPIAYLLSYTLYFIPLYLLAAAGIIVCACALGKFLEVTHPSRTDRDT